jgi:hypothetical protein
LKRIKGSAIGLKKGHAVENNMSGYLFPACSISAFSAKVAVEKKKEGWGEI